MDMILLYCQSVPSCAYKYDPASLLLLLYINEAAVGRRPMLIRAGCNGGYVLANVTYEAEDADGDCWRMLMRDSSEATEMLVATRVGRRWIRTRTGHAGLVSGVRRVSHCVGCVEVDDDLEGWRQKAGAT